MVSVHMQFPDIQEDGAISNHRARYSVIVAGVIVTYLAYAAHIPDYGLKWFVGFLFDGLVQVLVTSALSVFTWGVTLVFMVFYKSALAVLPSAVLGTGTLAALHYMESPSADAQAGFVFFAFPMLAGVAAGIGGLLGFLVDAVLTRRLRRPPNNPLDRSRP